MLFDADISNLALGMLGSTLTISNVSSDTSAQAKVIRRHFQSSLETLLEKYEWGFATKIAALSLVEEAPNDGVYAFSYRAPSDSLVVRRIGAESALQSVEDYEDERNEYEEFYDSSGVLIYSNIGDAFIRYTKNVSSSIAFPNHFGRALAAQLALDIAPSIITNNFAKIRNVLLIDAERKINDGIAADLNRKPRPKTSESRFVRVR
ncbi:MAG: hypothetical protein Unbinned1322contig1000_55 [Prokaryotic dsDNA virus sp.]|nr:MAG: hypothetical protein Unbinned1322contig1000_55 [Prokaryotic dsDNA virus sp.]|tara:strand:+ start:8685 stop:9302 length:618 start_codon:yes stop_codon:yes gene_type:complete